MVQWLLMSRELPTTSKIASKLLGPKDRVTHEKQAFVTTQEKNFKKTISSLQLLYS